MKIRLLLVLLFGILHSTVLFSAAPVDLTKAVVVAPQGLSKQEENAVRMLIEEVEKRSRVRWVLQHDWPAGRTPVVAVAPVSAVQEFRAHQAGSLEPAKSGAAEGYRITVRETSDSSAPAVLVVGNDSRGVLFGVGKLLTQLRVSPGRVLMPPIDIETSPQYPLRGHQLGYRPKTNSYDAFTADMWEQYIRDLSVFGTNAVELIPPRSDDDADSPHFPLPQIDMMVRMSQILDDYGLDVWIWYPALDENYSDPATAEFALEEWGEVFRLLPRIDAVFVPGGDPGHTQPKHLMALLEKQASNLRKHHPNAQMWMSPQSFNKEWMDEFYSIVKTGQPDWLAGIVYGPQTRVSLPELREAIPDKYPIRRYPDITHSIRCQYPVPNWDLAYVVTQDREVINPRPTGQAVIFKKFASYSNGFLTYSEGVNDDVNKIIWSGLGWDPEAKIIEILRDYSRYFLGEQYSDAFAQGLLALERNWEGPLLTNGNVYTTLAQFQRMERSGDPQLGLNWRFQQGLYRAYYDAYNRSRLIYETALEEQAMEILRAGPELGALRAMEEAEAILEKALRQRVSADWRARVFELAEALYQSIRMQLSVPRYQAISVGRGANLDLIDFPLNNRGWLKDQFARIRTIEDEQRRLEEIRRLREWTDPGPGGFYDDLGNPSRQPRLVTGPGFEEDPAFLRSALVGFYPRPDRRLSWLCHAEGLYDQPLKMQYDNLDPNAQYVVRVVYAGDRPRTKMQLLADDKHEVHAWISKEDPIRPVEFAVPMQATSDGRLTLTWRQEPGSGGAGRGNQVAEVWLIKKSSAQEASGKTAK